MKQVFIVTYDLTRPSRNYENLLRRIKSYNYWAKLAESSYLIHTESTHVQIRDYLSKALDSNDKLYVGVVNAPAAWVGLPKEVETWIHEHLK